MNKFALSKLYDLGAALPLLLLYAFGIAGLLLSIRKEIIIEVYAGSIVLAFTIVSEIAALIFLSLQFALFILRRLPTRKAQHFLARVAGIVGSNLMLGVLILPRVDRTTPGAIITTALTIVGLLGSIYVLAALGRSFSVLPQARGMVTTGPYRWVRHPLYLCEQITAFSMIWQYAQPWALFIALASAVGQFPRMYYEEQVLSETYPAYREYVAHTPRLIPGLY
jgi:protein-S-isoprenylcysteine O-methyltransferase Ste14